MKETNSCVLVTGGCGYVGSHVVRQLSETGFKPIVIDNLSTGRQESLVHGEVLIEGDIGNRELLDQIFSEYPISAVMHFAASIIVPESMVDPLLYYQNNTANTITLLQAAVARDVKRFIFSSTAMVYGGGQGLSEDAPVAPANPYGRSKLVDEWILEDVGAAHDSRHLILRYFNAAGADPKARMGQSGPQVTHLIRTAAQVALGMRPSLVVFGRDYDTPDGTGVRDYVHVEDLASAHLAALRYLEGGGASCTLNCGYGHGASVQDVLSSFERVLGRPLPVEYGTPRIGDIPWLVADVGRIHKTLDWQPQFDDLDQIVAHALEWERTLAE